MSFRLRNLGIFWTFIMPLRMQRGKRSLLEHLAKWGMQIRNLSEIRGCPRCRWNMLPTWSKHIALVNLRICIHHSNFLILLNCSNMYMIQSFWRHCWFKLNLSTMQFQESDINKKTNYRFGYNFDPILAVSWFQCISWCGWVCLQCLQANWEKDFGQDPWKDGVWLEDQV